MSREVGRSIDRYRIRLGPLSMVAQSLDCIRMQIHGLDPLEQRGEVSNWLATTKHPILSTSFARPQVSIALCWFTLLDSQVLFSYCSKTYHRPVFFSFPIRICPRRWRAFHPFAQQWQFWYLMPIAYISFLSSNLSPEILGHDWSPLCRRYVEFPYILLFFL